MKKVVYLFLLTVLVSCSSKGLKVDEVQKPADDKAQVVADVVKKEEVKLTETNKYFFAFNSAKFTKEEKMKLKNFLANLKAKAITVTGNCDERGSVAYNYKLGLERAKSVKKALLSCLKFKGKVSISSNGKTKPTIANAQTESEHAQNRVVVVSVNQ